MATITDHEKGLAHEAYKWADEPMSDVHSAVSYDKEHNYWFMHGTTPLGGSDFIRPLQVVDGDRVECETGNFHDKINLPLSEYMKIRQHPFEKVGMWDFAAPDPANNIIRMAARNPRSIGHRLYQAEAENKQLKAVVEAIKLLDPQGYEQAVEIIRYQATNNESQQ